MTEKTASKYLDNLEKNFSHDNPVLLRSIKIFHDLDQIEYDLGLIDEEETTASKSSWSPIVSFIGGNSTAKARFINAYLGDQQTTSGIQASTHKFTVLLQSNQTNLATLPGTALDVDPRYPFYQISKKMEQLQKGEGDKVNSHLELKAINSERLKGKLFIDSPNIGAIPESPVNSMLIKHMIDSSDLVIIFTDIFGSSIPLLDEVIKHIEQDQDSNKFVFLVDEPIAAINPAKANEIILTWQRKLAELNITTGQLIIAPNQQTNLNPQSKIDFSEIDQRLTNVSLDRTYRILNTLEKNIRDIEDVIFPEVRKGISLWKERTNLSSLVVLSFIAILGIFAEIEMGILELLIDPIIGPIVLIILAAILIPTHVLISKVHAKFIIKKLNERQKELHIMENLAGLFEKNLTITRIVLPINESVAWNKKMKTSLSGLSEKTKDLVQSLNDIFGNFSEPVIPKSQTIENQTNYLDLSKFK